MLIWQQHRCSTKKKIQENSEQINNIKIKISEHKKLNDKYNTLKFDQTELDIEARQT